VLPALRAHRRDRYHQAVAALSYVDPDANLDAHHVHAVPTQSNPHPHAVPAQSDPHAYTVHAYPHSYGDADSLHTDALANQYTPADRHAYPAR
jgi:hypothetical protein